VDSDPGTEGPLRNEDGSLVTTATGAGGDRILTVPNVITLVRLLCIPVFLWLLFGLENRAAAAILLGVLGATDWVDGYIARRYNQASNLGKQLDPIADRALMLVGIIAIMIDGSVPLWFGGLSLAREVIMSLWVAGVTLAGATRLDVTWYGKAGTFCQMFAFPMFLFSAGSTGWLHDVTQFLAWAVGLPGLVLSYIAFFQYFPRGLEALREGRALRLAAGQEGSG
jgi:cardiolipin synthase